MLPPIPAGIDPDTIDPRVKRLFTLPQPAQKSEEWLAMRRGLLTASDAAAALDIKPYPSYSGSPRADLLKKKAQQAIGLQTFQGNEYTRHGQQYEDEAIDLYSIKYNETVLEFGLVVHSEHTFLGGSPDGITLTPRLLEVKCPMTRKIMPGEVPHHYLPQIQLCMEIFDLDDTAFIQYRPTVVTFPGPPQFDVTFVPRDKQWFADNLPRFKVFHTEMRAVQEAAKANPLLYTPKVLVKRVKKAAPLTAACTIDDTLYEN